MDKENSNILDDNNSDPKNETKKEFPVGLWEKCKACGEILYVEDLEANLKVCPFCNYHFRMRGKEYIDLLVDKGSFIEYNQNLKSKDPLGFIDTKSYKERLDEAIKKTGINEAFISGEAKINNFPIEIGAFEFNFLGGSMASVVGEKIARLFEQAILKNHNVIIITASGGARMQESMFSLMQMAKTTAVLAKFKEKGLCFISVLTDPTSGGVSASFAMLGDINIAETNALICFAGPRVIEETIKQKLPKGFQRAEFLKDHGMVDIVLERKELKDTIAKILLFLSR